MTRMKGDYIWRIKEYESRCKDQGVISLEHDKALKSLANEKAVLSAAVEARDSKLTRMSDLQKENEKLKREVQDGKFVRNQLVSCLHGERAKLQPIRRTSVLTDIC